jgi:hypothetical protein
MPNFHPDDFEKVEMVEEENPQAGFYTELERLINIHSMENHSNTPDWILANYLKDCLIAFNKATNTRHVWYNAPADQVTEI